MTITDHATLYRIYLAAHWLDGTQDETILRAIQAHIDWSIPQPHAAFAQERQDHTERANRYATEKTGYDPHNIPTTTIDPSAILRLDVPVSSDAGCLPPDLGWLVLRDAELNRLESAARERRILALAACLR